MDNKKLRARAALNSAKDMIFTSLAIAEKEIDELHISNRSKDERIESDAEFIANLQAQIKVLNLESYELKAERDVWRGKNYQGIIWQGISGLMAVVWAVSSWL